MNMETGDTIVVKTSDTLRAEPSHREFMLGRYIPVQENVRENPERDIFHADKQKDYYTTAERSAGELRPPEIVSTDFSFAVLSVTLVLLAALTIGGRKIIEAGLSSLSFRRQPETLTPGTSGVFSWPPFFRNIFTVINISLFATASIIISGALPNEGGAAMIKLTSIIAGSFLSALLIRHLVSILLAEMTGLQPLFREYMNVIYNTWFVNAFFLFLLNFLIIFSLTDHAIPLIILGIIASSLLLLLRILRLLSIFLNRHVSILYFILYLCALEVLPLLLIMKVLGIF